MKPLHAFLARFAPSLHKMTAATTGSGAAGEDAARLRAKTAADIASTIDQALTAAGLRPGTDRADTIYAAADVAAVRAARPAAQPIVGDAPFVARARSPGEPTIPDRPHAAPPGVSFERQFGNAAGSRAYTLYVPAGLDPDVPAPLLLMLHGCTQNPADFATGTRMNALADRHGVLIAYPAQTPRDHGARCWNWFRRQDQQRGAGEPSILAGIVADISADHRVDPQRVYVAGLSAGAAMAVILGHTYPDVFAAVGAHSGLPFGAAHDMPGAFAAMQGRSTPPRNRAGATGDTRAMPTIVFHGDADRTVDCSNGRAIVQESVEASAGAAPTPLQSTQASAGGRTYTRETYGETSGPTLVEHWNLHGGGHAWSGGDPAGSHVDPAGPDASAEMLRFFLQHRNAGTL